MSMSVNQLKKKLVIHITINGRAVNNPFCEGIYVKQFTFMKTTKVSTVCFFKLKLEVLVSVVGTLDPVFFNFETN